MALVPFALVWNPYARAGASLTRLGLLLVLPGLLIAAEDWINYALGWPTPLNQFWYGSTARYGDPHPVLGTESDKIYLL